jgi:hypothetical protein
MLVVLQRRHEHPGRPTSYSSDLRELAHNDCLRGATNDALAEFFGVSPRAMPPSEGPNMAIVVHPKSETVK